MDKKFPGAKGFFDALLINPSEIFRYFVLNGLSNISKLPSLIRQHSILLPTYQIVLKGYKLLMLERKITLLFIVLSSVWLLWSFIIKTSPRQWFKQLWKDDYLFFLTSLAAVSAPAMLLLIPYTRYWITLTPLFFWGPAAFVSNFSRSLNGKSLLITGLAAVFIFANPVSSSLWNLNSNPQKEWILSFREKILALDNLDNKFGNKAQIKILGWWPGPLCIFAAPGRCKSTNIWDIPKGSSFRSLIESMTYDLIYIDGNLRSTRRYKLECKFIDSFVQAPENFGYQMFLASEDRSSTIFRRAGAIT